MDAQNQGDKRRLRGKKTRAKILESARELFSSQGYHATTTRQITEKAGITGGAIYNHFDSKKAIFEAVIASYHPWTHIPVAVAEAQGDDIIEFVRDAAKRMLSIWQNHPENMRLHWIELIEFQGKHLPGLFEESFQQMADILQERADSLQKVGETPAVLSRALLGLFFAYLLTDQPVGIAGIWGPGQNAFDYFTDTYLHGVLAQVSERANKRLPD